MLSNIEFPVTHEIEQGSINFRIIPKERLIFIDLLQVETRHRRKGFGRNLLRFVLALADELEFAVELEARGQFEDPMILIHFYMNEGFGKPYGGYNHMRRA